MKELDYETLSPGIREFVRELREIHNFPTTDSGDGTNLANGMGGALPYRHVFLCYDKVKEAVIDAKLASVLYPDAWVEMAWRPGQSPNIMICPDGMPPEWPE